MPTIDRQDSVLTILQNLRDLDGLKRLFWEELNYERENRPLSPRQWPESARQPLAEDPILFATGGEDNAFHVVYCRLESDALLRGHERPIVNRLTREHPYALFVFSNKGRTDWHFLNVKYDEEADKRRLLRRITVRPGEGLRTAAERMQMLDLETISQDLFALSPLTIQQRHDDAFDVEKVTKDFYREIANWYFWALKHVTFPKDAPKEEDGRDHISVIRLITRLIFCWFIREKGLIPDVLFDEPKLAGMLDGFAPGKTRNRDSVYYRAILQNLFFATLNTEMDQRGWRRADQNFMAHSLYRHKECFRDPKAGLEWFKDIPFLNGGLFECLDRDFGEGAKPRYLRVDGFSDRDDSRPTVPDFLFFGSGQDVDLSGDYGDKKFRSVRVRGLIDTLSRYKFTIEENTPLDQEVALDPELCGKVFENLLAAYNPETGTTARKATGSFYTPREIVDYMVDESLVAYLKGKLTGKAAKDPDKPLRALLAYDGEPHGFDEQATGELIDAIDGLKALDPAVGSGAFPMGILHKLVLVLGKLDPDNERWKAKQIAKLDDAAMREDAERLFRENYDDYGRKLYLIENCIYGVDIQPIAVQIAKMRFFISLIVDQRVNPKAPNVGVRALPNLETKFVAANALIGIGRPAQMMLRNPDIDKKEAELRKVREKHFTARTLKSKAKCREDDKRLRAEIAELLKDDGWDNTTARQLAAWDPYDQNTSADFFDAEWMFGVTNGFDIAIGNPPYGLLNKRQNKAESIVVTPEALDYFKSTPVYQPALGGMINIFRLFIVKSIDLLCHGGVFSEIFPLAFTADASMGNLRKHLLQNHRICFIEAFPERDNVARRVFEASKMSVCIMQLLRGDPGDTPFHVRISGDRFVDLSSNRACLTARSVLLLDKDNATIPLVTQPELDLLEKIYRQSVRVGDLGHCFTGEVDLTLGKDLITQDETNPPLLRGAGITKYGILSKMSQGELLYIKERRFLQSASARKVAHTKAERIIMQGITGVNEKTRLRMTLVPAGTYLANSVNYLVFDSEKDLKVVLGVLNSRLVNFVFARFSTNSNVNGYEVDNLPLPKRVTDEAAIVELVDNMLAARKKNPSGNVSNAEAKLDRLVYGLYGLTAQEITIVEGSREG